MQERFRDYLTSRGFSIVTPTGRESTVDDYVRRIQRICDRERVSWEGLAVNIAVILPIYDLGGSKEVLGLKSHSAYINALRRFQEFLKDQ